MSIARLSGQMLQSTLLRDGINLSIQNVASSNSTLYLDIANTQVGINANIPAATLDVKGNVLANYYTANIGVSATGNVDAGNLVTLGNAVVGNILTDNYYYANGAPVDFQQAAGSNTQIQFNNNNDFGASANLTFDTATDLFTLVGIANISTIEVTSTASVVGNITGGNVSTAGNVNGANLVGGNLLGIYASVSGNIETTSYVIASNIISNSELTVASSSAGNILINAAGYTKVVGSTALYIPVGNTGQRPLTPDVGALRFNTTNSTLEVWDGAEWDSATGGLSAITNQTIIPDGSTSTYTLDQSATADSILVSMNGVSQTPSIDYTVTGNSISFTTTPLDTDIVQVRFIASTSTVIGVQNGNSIIQIANSNSNATVTIGGVANIATFANTGVFVNTLSAAANLALPVYTVATANALSGISTGQVIYVSDGDSGNPCLAVYSGSAWHRIALGATIST